MSLLFKYFEQEEHAQDFLKGKIRFMPLTDYNTIKCESRIDENDGTTPIRFFNSSDTGNVIHPGNSVRIDFLNNGTVDFKGFDITPFVPHNTDMISDQYHCFCSSMQLLDALKDKYGKYVVCFNLFNIVGKLQELKDIGGIKDFSYNGVIYIDNEARNKLFDKLKPILPNNLYQYLFIRDILTKDTKFKEDYEVRITLILNQCSDKEFYVELPKIDGVLL